MPSMTLLHAAPAALRTSASLLLFLVCWVGIRPSFAADTDLGERYERAIQSLPWHIERRVHGMSVKPHWSADGRSFWYEEDRADGSRYWSVSLEPLSRKRLAVRPAASPGQARKRGWLMSPNGAWAVRRQGDQLVRIDLGDGSERPLTADGEADYRYGSLRGAPTLTSKLTDDEDLPQGVWSPEGDRFLTYRVDERQLYKMPFLVATKPGATHALPWVHYQNAAFRYSPKMQRADLVVFDLRKGSRVDLKMPKPFVASNGGNRWSADGTQLFVAVNNDDGLTSTAYAVDAATGDFRAMVTDSIESEISPYERFSYVDGGRQVVVYSLRSDWGHLYLHDGTTGKQLRALTSGAWAVSEVLRVDDAGRFVYFAAKGREPGHHPNHSHLYRVSLDGGDPELLTPEDAQHDVTFSPDGAWFVDTYSTLSKAPVSVLRRADGKQSLELQRADISGLEAMGWKPPIPFTLTSDDGKSNLHGVLYLPYDLDSKGSYPLIESGYFDGDFVQSRFLGSLSWHGSAQAMAQLGFAVMEFEGREGKYHSRKEHLDFEDPKAVEPGFYDDHIRAMKYLAARYPFVDISRVGVYGHSNGGWRAARALLQRPDIYKVGIATAGSHDYGTWRATRPPKAGQKEFDFATNMQIAGNLQGKLLLMHGLADDNVHVAQSLQLAQAFIEQGKRFDMLILPEKNHKDLWMSEYANLRAWDYFVENLLGRQPPSGAGAPKP